MPKKKINEETRAEILAAYHAGGVTYSELASEFGVAITTVMKIVKSSEPQDGIDMMKANRKHAESMQQKREEHAAMTTWMEHVEPLHKHKQRLEAEIAEKQAELDKARQEYQNFLATLEQLTKQEA